MNKETKDNLWEELKLLQSKIDKIDDFTFRIKNWFITIFIALTGYSIGYKKTKLLILNIFLILIFYVYEVTYRMVNKAFLERSREIEKILREGKEISEEDKPPHLDKYLPEKYPFKYIMNESKKRLAQYRVSLIYIAALIINSIIALIFLEGYALFISLFIIVSIIYINSTPFFTKKET